MNLSRRGFLKALGISASSAVAGVALPAQAMDTERQSLDTLQSGGTRFDRTVNDSGVWITSEDSRRWVPFTVDDANEPYPED